MLRFLFSFLISHSAFAADMLISQSLGNKTFKIAVKAQISKEFHAQVKSELQKMNLEPLPKGAVAPGGVLIDSVFVGPKREVIAVTNKFILEHAKLDQLYSVGTDFWYYSSRKEDGAPVSIYLGNVSRDQAAQLIKKLKSIQPSRKTASETVASVSDGEVNAEQKQAAALREAELFKRSEEFQSAMLGCAKGYEQVWETYWAKPVRTIATMIIHPVESGKSIKAEALGYWDGGWPMIKDFFKSAYEEIADFGNWPVEKKSQFFCNLQATGGALKLAKVYYPKPANDAALVMSKQVKEALAKVSDEPLERLGLKDLLAKGVPEQLAARLAKNPEMAKTYLNLMRANVSAAFTIDESGPGQALTSSRITEFGTERLTIKPDGKLTISYYGDAFFNQPAEMMANARNGIQEAIAETRQATGSASYQPSRYWEVEAEPGLPGVRASGHYGGVILSLNGTTEDMTFLNTLRQMPQREIGPAPVLMRPSNAP